MGETEWERALWAEYHTTNTVTPTRPLLPGLCGVIVTYQTMLRNSNRDRGWGEVDLLGVRPKALTPVVIEVKDARGGDTPLRGIIEGTAYALALRKAWSHRLREDWALALAAQLGPEVSARGQPALPPALAVVPVIIAAPEAYLADADRDPTGPHQRTCTAERMAGAPTINHSPRRARHRDRLCESPRGWVDQGRQTAAGDRAAAAAAPRADPQSSGRGRGHHRLRLAPVGGVIVGPRADERGCAPRRGD